ncbi:MULTISPECIES: single-stranded DNA-binding protein [Olivibacter]|jgi:single-strand DNA-binding protein|uniref:Single-stranded DNA-binding protein n=2 Tax=Olivibacter TaxID=376469 RepID=A0ABV6HQU9_9SPHI|nr:MULTISPECIES: single-stranded DNA-binding protein [Olivibacter]MCL4639080.1 single-stranded DNA-binding protein [Olivibacter sp. UJ_SKK_5.1]MDM8173862.1 single-stranded DNA-binding protein [Olivibacter sp. 47]MDX3915046.1 single-stranded DNA-binding protein [Pseudosphingobacterium sp.]QEL03652.1 single-stranded DNA-binding protein [Olivibacter sp. LS-1]
MSTLKNSVRLTGFLGNKPVIKKFGDNKCLARVSLATNERYKNQEGEWLTDTQWHQLVFWGKEASFVEKSLDKGSEISIEGRLINRSYTDKEGVIRYATEIVVNEVQAIRKMETHSE